MICFIHTPAPELRDDRLDPPMGLLYLATYLKIRDWEVSVVDLSGTKESDWKKLIPKANYYGFSTYTANYHLTLKIRDIALSKNSEAITIAGGAHASALPDDVAQDFDYVVAGEGEMVIQMILEGMLQRGIIHGEMVTNLDKLPFVDFSLVDLSSYNRMIEGKRAVPIFSSRGCLYSCNFCTVRGISKRYRQRSVKHFVKEIRHILDNYGDYHFRIKDDLFGRDISWIKEFTRMTPKITYDCLLRGDFDINIIPYLKRSGCIMASIGIESGSNVILNRMNKKTTKLINKRAITSLRDNGIKVLAWFIVGFPGETWDTINETVEFINDTAPDIVTIYPLIPYPGSDVYCNRDKYGLRIIDDDFSHYYYIKGNYDAGYVYETDTLTPSIIQEMRQYVIDNVTASEVR